MNIKRLAKKAIVYALSAVGALTALQLYLLNEIPKNLETAEEYLEAMGLDPNIVNDLSDRKIKIIERDTGDYILMLSKFPFEANEIFNSMANPYWAAADRRPMFHDECHVIIPAGEFKAKTIISSLARIEEAKINTVNVSDENMKLAMIFHEFRHCHSKNHLQKVSDEADSDLNALIKVTELTGSWETYKTFMYARALGEMYGKYETSLYLDAHILGEDLPNGKEIQNVANNAFSQLRLYLEDDDLVNWSNGNYQNISLSGLYYGFNEIARSRLFNYPENVRNRASLYVEAIEYFDIPVDKNYGKLESSTPTS
jgi:hypothetical protein